jgi:hypothetical protein
VHLVELLNKSVALVCQLNFLSVLVEVEQSVFDLVSPVKVLCLDLSVLVSEVDVEELIDAVLLVPGDQLFVFEVSH